MPLLSKSVAVESLSPYLDVVRHIILGAWQDYAEYPASAKIVHDQTTRANIVNNHIIARANKAFMGDKRIKIFDKPRQSIFVFDQKISLRLKKLDADLMPQNVATSRVRRMNGQETIGDLESAHHLVAGYILNSLQTEIASIYLVCPNNKKIFWEVEIKDNEIVSTVHDLFEAEDDIGFGSGFEKKQNAPIEQPKNGTKNQS